MKITKTLKLYSLQILLLVAVVLSFLFFTGKKTGEKRGLACESLRTGWTVVQENGETDYYENCRNM